MRPSSVPSARAKPPASRARINLPMTGSRAFQPIDAEHDISAFCLALRHSKAQAAAPQRPAPAVTTQPVVLNVRERTQDARKRKTGIDEDRRNAGNQHEYDDDDRDQRHQDQDHRIDQRGGNLVANFEPARQQFGDLLENLPGNASGFAGGQNRAIVRRKYLGPSAPSPPTAAAPASTSLRSPLARRAVFGDGARSCDDPKCGIERQPGIGQRGQFDRKGRQFLQAETIGLNELAFPDRSIGLPRQRADDWLDRSDRCASATP